MASPSSSFPPSLTLPLPSLPSIPMLQVDLAFLSVHLILSHQVCHSFHWYPVQVKGVMVMGGAMGGATYGYAWLTWVTLRMSVKDTGSK